MNDKMDTKEKILTSAHTLFGDKGLHGTSMREIANHAEVALSAINYHYHSKENLANEVIKEAISCLRSHTQEVVENNREKSFKETMLQFFEILMSEAANFSRTFKIIQTTEVDLIFENPAELEYGPPGASFLFEKLTDEVGEEIPKEKRIWLIQTLLHNMDYIALVSQTAVMNNPIIKEKFSMEQKKQSIGQLIDATMGYILKN